MTMWILVLFMMGYGGSIHSIDGFETREKCQAAAAAVVAAESYINTVCIEQTWEGN